MENGTSSDPRSIFFLMLLFFAISTYLRGFIFEKRGEIKLSMIVVGVILLVAYFAFPDPIFSFIHYLKHMIFSALHSSFDHGSKKPHHGKIFPDQNHHSNGGTPSRAQGGQK